MASMGEFQGKSHCWPKRTQRLISHLPKISWLYPRLWGKYFVDWWDKSWTFGRCVPVTSRVGCRFFFFFDTGAKSILLKWYRCLNGAWTDTYNKKNYQLIIGLTISTTYDVFFIHTGRQRAPSHRKSTYPVTEVAELMKLQGYGQRHCYRCNWVNRRYKCFEW